MAESESNGTCKTSPVKDAKEENPVAVKKLIVEPSSTETADAEKVEIPAKNGHEKAAGKHHIQETNGADNEDSNDAEPEKKKGRPSTELPDVVTSGDDHSNPAAISEASDEHRDDDEDDEDDVGEGPEEDEEDSEEGNE